MNIFKDVQIVTSCRLCQGKDGLHNYQSSHPLVGRAERQITVYFDIGYMLCVGCLVLGDVSCSGWSVVFWVEFCVLGGVLCSG